MSFEQKDNEGAIFKNDRKQGDNDPSMKGSAKIGGVEYWISAWTNTDKNGNKYQKLSYSAKEGQGYTPQQENQLHKEGAVKASQGGKDSADDFDDDIPFN